MALKLLLRAATMMHAPDRTVRALAATFRIYLVANVSCHDIAGIWVAFVSRWQRYRRRRQGNPGDFVEPTGRSLKAITTVEATTEWGKADGALMMHAELDLDRVTQIRRQMPVGEHRRLC